MGKPGLEVFKFAFYLSIPAVVGLVVNPRTIRDWVRL
jgi:hypothetical protein